MASPTHEMLRDYADAFRVHGALSNPVWFLGPGEVGGADLDEVDRQVAAWDRAGRPRATDLDASDESPFGDDEGAPPTLQTTRANQLRVLLGMRGEPMDNRAIRRLQALEHGRAGGPTCLMELFPLPCRDDAWIYDRVPHDPERDGPNVFASRSECREHYLPRRLETLAALVHEHRPTALVCMCWTYRGQIVSMLEDAEIPDLGLESARRRAVTGMLGDTVVAVCSHPSKRIAGPKNEFYHRLGRAIAERMGPEAELPLAA